ncbi:hypothetical protein Bbelb_161420 [Branchiostoma belcheri]|nr:hypothetical protein Bbelb_161420 [Branchiostoma belcheri]
MTVIAESVTETSTMSMSSSTTTVSVTTSTEIDVRYTVTQAKFGVVETKDEAGAWCAATNDDKQFLLIDLEQEKLVTGIVTQGRNSSPDWPDGPTSHWVTSYTVSYGVENGDENEYKDANGELKTFQGNKDRDTPVTHNFAKFSGPFKARYVKIHPVTWNDHICMRADMIVEDEVKKEVKEIAKKEEQMTVIAESVTETSVIASSVVAVSVTTSTEKDVRYTVTQAKFGVVETKDEAGAWCAATNDDKQFLLIDLEQEKLVTGIVTQGRNSSPDWPDGPTSHWVTSYTLTYGVENGDENEYKDAKGELKVFKGNTDTDSPVTHSFAQFNGPFNARFIKIHPVTWNEHICMRADMIVEDPVKKELKEVAKKEEQMTVIAESVTETSVIASSSVTVSVTTSTEIDVRYTVTQAKFGVVETKDEAGAWCAATNDDKQFLLIDLEQEKLVTGIVTQGRNSSPDWPDGPTSHWVTSYTLTYGVENGDENEYKDAKGELMVFKGNKDRDTPVTHNFAKYNGHFNARFVKIHPVTWNDHICMRADMIVEDAKKKEVKEVAKRVETMTAIAETVTETSVMASSSITVSVTTSTELDVRYTVTQAKFGVVETKDEAGAWCAATNDDKQFLLIDLEQEKLVTGIVTQGRNSSPDWPDGPTSHWVTSFTLSYGLENGDETQYMDKKGELKVFKGNTDTDTPVTNNFAQFNGPFKARYVKIHPVTWNDHICMRADMIVEDEKKKEVKEIAKKEEQMTVIAESVTETSVVASSSISVVVTTSTEKDVRYTVTQAKFGVVETKDEAGAWCAATNDDKQFLLIDLEQEKLVTGIVTQGRNSSPDWPDGPTSHWVTSYTLTYGVENGDENEYKDKKGELKRALKARFVKIHPVTWNEHICMRADMIVEDEVKKQLKEVAKKEEQMTVVAESVTETSVIASTTSTVIVTTSTEKDVRYTVTQAKFGVVETKDEAGAWCAATNDDKQFLLIDLEQKKLVTGIVTQGRNSSPDWPDGLTSHWVTSYTLTYGVENGDENEYKDKKGELKVFKGNEDTDSPVTHNFAKFSGPFKARYVKIHPVTWNDHICMRADMIVEDEVKKEMKAVAKKEEQMTVIAESVTETSVVASSSISVVVTTSTEKDVRYTVTQAKFGVVETKDEAGAWCAATNDDKQFLLIDLEQEKLVTGIVTQGRNSSPDWPDGPTSHWVTSYTLTYGVENGDENEYKDADGQLLVFDGNKDRDTPVTQNFADFNGPFNARFVKIHPVTWNEHICMRADMIVEDEIKKQVKEVVQQEKKMTAIAESVTETSVMASSSITVSVTTSTEIDVRYTVTQAKFGVVETKDEAGAWCAATNDDKQFLLIDLEQEKLVTGIVTQGRNSSPDWPDGPTSHWVTSYTLSYGLENGDENEYKDDKGELLVFTGNTDRDTPVTQSFDKFVGPFQARFVKIHPVTWNDHICMRADMIVEDAAKKEVKEVAKREEKKTVIAQSISETSVMASSTTTVSVTTSTEIDVRYTVTQAKFGVVETKHEAGAWCAATNDDKQFLLIDLEQEKLVTGIVTQGRNSSPDWPDGPTSHWVTSYTLSYGVENGDENEYKDKAGELQVFPGNKDTDTPVTHDLLKFNGSFKARYVKIHPVTWNDHICMRADLVVEDEIKKQAMEVAVKEEKMASIVETVTETSVMASSSITVVVTSSTEIDTRYTVTQAKFGVVETKDEAGAWCAAANDDKQFLLIDLDSEQFVTGIVTQGRNSSPDWPDGPTSQWVTSYTLSYGVENGDENEYKDKKGELLVFKANEDTDTPVTHSFADFNGPFKLVTSRSTLSHEQKKLEVSQIKTEAIMTSITVSVSMVTVVATVTSSEMSVHHAVSYSKLECVETATEAGAWVAKTNDEKQFLLIDLGSKKIATEIITKGRNSNPNGPDGETSQWVTSYTISYGIENGDETEYKDENGQLVVFEGNVDRDSAVVHSFAEYSGTFYARFVKIHPVTWHEHIAMRAEIVCDDGCWIGREPPWVIESSGTAEEKDGVKCEAANVLDPVAGLYWSPMVDVKTHYNRWYIVFDFKSCYTLTRLRLVNCGDTTHDIKSFILQKAACTKPFHWGDVLEVSKVKPGSKKPQEFGCFSGTARYWRLLVTSTHEGAQPNLANVDFFGSKGEWFVQHPPTAIEASGTPVEQEGVLYDANKTLVASTKTYWKTNDAPAIKEWYIVYDFRMAFTITKISITNFGDKTHDVKAFTLQTSATAEPYEWTDVKTFSDVVAESKDGQVFGDFTGEGRYWRLLVTETHGGAQPYIVQVKFFGWADKEDRFVHVRSSQLTSFVKENWTYKMKIVELETKLAVSTEAGEIAETTNLKANNETGEKEKKEDARAKETEKDKDTKEDDKKEKAEKDVVDGTEKTEVTVKEETTVHEETEKTEVSMKEETTVVEETQVTKKEETAVVDGTEKTEVTVKEETTVHEETEKTEVSMKEETTVVEETQVTKKEETAVVQETDKTEVTEKEETAVVEETKTTEVAQKEETSVVEETKTEVVKKEETAVVEETKTEVAQKKETSVVEEAKTEVAKKEETSVVEKTKTTEVSQKEETAVVEETKTTEVAQKEQTAVVEEIKTTEVAKKEETVMVEETKTTEVAQKEETAVVEETKTKEVAQKEETSVVEETKTTEVAQKEEIAVVEETKTTEVAQKEETAVVEETKTTEVAQKEEISVVEETKTEVAQKEQTSVVEETKTEVAQTEETSVVEETKTEVAQKEETSVVEETKTTEVAQKEETAVVEETKTTEVAQKEETAVVEETKTTEVAQKEETAVVEETKTTEVAQKEETAVVEETKTTEVAQKETAVVEETKTTEVAQKEETAVVEETKTTEVAQKEETAVVEETKTTEVAQKEETAVVEETKTTEVAKKEETAVVEETKTTTVAQKEETAVVEETKTTEVAKKEETAVVEETKTEVAQKEETAVVEETKTTEVAKKEETAVVEETKTTEVAQKEETFVVEETKTTEVAQKEETAVVEETKTTEVAQKEETAVVEETKTTEVAQKEETAVVEETKTTEVAKKEETAVVGETKTEVAQKQETSVVEETKTTEVAQKEETAVVEETKTTEVAQKEETALVEETKTTEVAKKEETAVVEETKTEVAQKEETAVVEETKTTEVAKKEETAVVQETETTEVAKKEETAVVEETKTEVAQKEEAAVVEETKTTEVTQKEETAVVEETKTTEVAQKEETAVVEETKTTEVAKKEETAVVEETKTTEVAQKEETSVVEETKTEVAQKEETSVVEETKTTEVTQERVEAKKEETATEVSVTQEKTETKEETTVVAEAAKTEVTKEEKVEAKNKETATEVSVTQEETKKTETKEETTVVAEAVKTEVMKEEKVEAKKEETATKVSVTQEKTETKEETAVAEVAKTEVTKEAKVEVKKEAATEVSVTQEKTETKEETTVVAEAVKTEVTKEEKTKIKEAATEVSVTQEKTETKEETTVVAEAAKTEVTKEEKMEAKLKETATEVSVTQEKTETKAETVVAEGAKTEVTKEETVEAKKEETAIEVSVTQEKTETKEETTVVAEAAKNVVLKEEKVKVKKEETATEVSVAREKTETKAETVVAEAAKTEVTKEETVEAKKEETAIEVSVTQEKTETKDETTAVAEVAKTEVTKEAKVEVKKEEAATKVSVTQEETKMTEIKEETTVVSEAAKTEVTKEEKMEAKKEEETVTESSTSVDIKAQELDKVAAHAVSKEQELTKAEVAKEELSIKKEESSVHVETIQKAMVFKSEPIKLQSEMKAKMTAITTTISKQSVFASTTITIVVTTSSVLSVQTSVTRAKFSCIETATEAGAWCAKVNDDKQFLLIDLESAQLVTGIVTQGRNSSPDWPGGPTQQWVTSYKISYGMENGDETEYKDAKGEVVIFNGNVDTDTPVTHSFKTFNGTFTARYVKIHMVTWHEHIAMRAEMIIEKAKQASTSTKEKTSTSASSGLLAKGFSFLTSKVKTKLVTFTFGETATKMTTSKRKKKSSHKKKATTSKSVPGIKAHLQERCPLT